MMAVVDMATSCPHMAQCSPHHGVHHHTIRCAKESGMAHVFWQQHGNMACCIMAHGVATITQHSWVHGTTWFVAPQWCTWPNMAMPSQDDVCVLWCWCLCVCVTVNCGNPGTCRFISAALYMLYIYSAAERARIRIVASTGHVV